MVLETLPSERVGEFYEEATRGRSASHHLQVKAALALLYHVLGSTNPFAECAAPKFAAEKIELRYHTASQLGQLLRELREDRRLASLQELTAASFVASPPATQSFI